MKNNNNNTSNKENINNQKAQTSCYNNLTSHYPYGELPLQYTKSGQEQLKKPHENKVFNNHYSNENNQNNLNDNKKDLNETAQTTDANHNSNTNSALDINQILPLLSSFGGESADLIKQIMPFKNSNKNLDMADLLKFFGNFKKPTNTQKSNSTTKTENNYIDNLKKVE